MDTSGKMKIDTSVWNNKERMQKRIRDLGKIILSITAVNIFTLISYKSWVVMGINILFFITTIPIFLSWAKYEKEPPYQEKKINTDEEIVRRIINGNKRT